MKIILKSEEAVQLIVSLMAVHALHLSWMWFWIMFLAPDLGMLGYLAGSGVGAITYNLLHHKGIALLIFIIGYSMTSMQFEFAGILLFAHSSFDRMLGYGLKFPDGFHHTHLGMIGKTKKE